MHKESINIMTELLKQYYNGEDVIDIGGADINGSYRNLFPDDKYESMDLHPGKNVDIVGWENITKTYDFVISGQTIEHTKNPFEFVRSLLAIANEGAKIIIIAPAQWAEHKYPIDCWRILPDGYRAIAEELGIQIVNTGMQIGKDGIDSYAVFVK